MKLPPQLEAAWQAWKVGILLAIALALLALGFAGGLRWQAGKVAEAKAARDEATRTAQAWKDRAGEYEHGVRGWEKRYAADEAADRKQRERAEAILDRLEAQKQEAKRKADEWQRRYEEAKRTPDCAELLKETTCAIFRSY